MKIKEQTGMQGDTQWYSIAVIPNNAKKVNKQFIAASEISGNVHALCGKYDMYEIPEGHIMDVKEDCILNHTAQELVGKVWNNPEVLPKRDHRHSVIKKGLYYVGIQQRFDPMSAMKQRVID